jgi:predicted transcriptional regulator
VETVSVSSLARRKNFLCVPETATLDDVAKLLVHKGCHRVPVIDETGEIVNIISQSTIIKSVAHRRDYRRCHCHPHNHHHQPQHTHARAQAGTRQSLCMHATC